MRIQVLSSGSKGNLLHLTSRSARVLVDAGLSCKEIERRMKTVGLDPAELDAILVTHEHGDHIRGISVLSRRYRIPVHVCANAWRHISKKDPNWYKIITFEPGCEFQIGGLSVHPFRIPHDTSDPVAFAFQDGFIKFGMATDLGAAPELVVDALSNSHALLLESNHDEDMLVNGPYPWFLKRRIASRHGHLSNFQSAELLQRLLHPGLQAVILAHLSEENNTPELAHETATQILRESGRDIRLLVAGQEAPLPVVDLSTIKPESI